MIVIKLYNDILETSTDSLYINIMRFTGFFRVQIHSWNANVSWTLQFTSSGRGTAWYWAIPPDRPFYILRYLWSGEGEEKNCGWGRGGNRSILINRENNFPYFIYVVAIIFIQIVRVFLYLYMASLYFLYFLENMM